MLPDGKISGLSTDNKERRDKSCLVREGDCTDMRSGDRTGHCITTQERRAEQRRFSTNCGRTLLTRLALNTTNGRNRSHYELFAAEIFGLFSSAPPTHAAVAVGSVGVGAAVDR